MKKNRKTSALNGVIIATGVSSVVTQLLTVREFLAQFEGNEFVIAVVLFNWLVLGGTGTLLARLFEKKRSPSYPRLLGWLSLAASAMPVLHILIIRALRDIFFIHGSMAGFYGFFLFSLLTTAPYCLLVGFLLPLGLLAIRARIPSYPGAMVYMADNAGDIAGGALFSFVLVFFLSPMQALLLSGLPLLFCSAYLLRSEKVTVSRLLPAAAATGGVLLAGVLLELPSITPPEGQLVDYHESRYSRITVIKQAGQYTLFSDGRPIAGSANRQQAEETAHYPLSQLKRPDSVMLVSAVSGVIKEVFKHHPENVDYVELDPEISDAMFRYNLLAPRKNVTVINRDARLVLAGSDKKYNAIIVCMPDPDTFQTNRFYTESFFELARGHLTKDGVLAFSMEGFDAYLTETDREKISVVYNTAARVFPHVTILPSEKIFFLCTNRPVNPDIPGLLKEKKVPTEYISGFFYGNVTPERIAYINLLLDRSAPVNTDTRPVLMKLMFDRWFTLFSESRHIFYIVSGLLLLIWLVRIDRGGFVLFSNGAAHMASEIIAIFAFQIFFGYIYFQIGLIVTMFLAGLLPGAWIGNRLKARSRTAIIGLDFFLVALLGAFTFLAYRLGSRMPPVSYLVFGFLVSWACGFQFTAILQRFGDTDRHATGAFSADLVGAAFGALLASVLLIPNIGIAGTAAVLIAVKLLSIIAVGTDHGKTHKT